jgi:hypothetical protein
LAQFAASPQQDIKACSLFRGRLDRHAGARRRGTWAMSAITIVRVRMHSNFLASRERSADSE